MHGKTFEKIIFLDFIKKTRLENLSDILMVQSVFRISIRGLNTLTYTATIIVEKPMSNPVVISTLVMTVSSFTPNVSMFNK